MRILKVFHYRPWLVCLSSSLVFFNDFVQMSFLGVLGPFFIKYYGLSALEFGHLSSVYFYSMAFFIVPAGIILDKLSIRKIFLLVTLTYAMCPLLYIVSAHFIVLYLGRMLSGMAASFCLIGSIALAKRWFPKDKLGLVIGTIIIVGMSGGFFAQAPFAYLVNLWGWKIALFYISCSAIFAFIVVSLFVFDSPMMPVLEEGKSKKLPIYQSLIFVLKIKYLWILGLCAGALNVPISLLATVWGNLYLLQTSNISQADGAIVVSMIFVGMLVGAPLVGYIFDRLKNISKLLLISGLITCLLLLLSIQNKNFYFLVTICFLMGLSCSCHTVVYSFIARDLPVSVVALAEGLLSSIVMIMSPAYQIAYGYFLEYQWSGIYEEGVKHYSSQSHHLSILFICVLLFICLIMCDFLAKRDWFESPRLKRIEADI